MRCEANIGTLFLVNNIFGGIIDLSYPPDKGGIWLRSYHESGLLR